MTTTSNRPASSNIISRVRQAARLVFTGRSSSGRLQNARPGNEIPSITPEEVAEAKLFFPMDKYFIFGHARSGTTLLTRLVRLHPQVHCNYQAHFFTRPPLLQSLVSDSDVGAWLSRRSNRWNRGRDLSPVVLRAVSDFIMERDARREGKSVVGDKSPNSLLDGEAVHLMVKVYPDARLVFIVRDGRDAAISHRFQAFIDNPQSLSREDLRIREDYVQNAEAYLSGQRSLFTEKEIRRAAEGWAHNVQDTHQTALGLLSGGDHSLYHFLRYEDLLSNPHYMMSKIWAFLGVDPDASGLAESLTAELQQNPDADWQLQKAEELASAFQKGKAGSWQNILTARDKQIFWEIAGETLSSWGYEL